MEKETESRFSRLEILYWRIMRWRSKDKPVFQFVEWIEFFLNDFSPKGVYSIYSFICLK